jgi:Domain of unknown function (DUF4192)
MTMSENSALRIIGPADLLCAVPYLLGFQPENSLVIVGLADSGQLVVTVRLDLADVGEVESCLSETVEAIVRGGTTKVLGVVFTETQPDMNGLLPHADVVAVLVREAECAAVEMTDCMVVVGRTWWSYACIDATCCPAEGTPLPAEPTALDAAATYAGMAALPDRAALASMFDPLPDRSDLSAALVAEQEIELNAVLLGRHHRYVRSVTRALFAAHRAAQAGRMPSDREAARYGVGLQGYVVRDAVWLAVDDDRLDGLELWVNVARRLPSPYNAAPLFLAAWRAWRDGNGALAGIAAELALDSDPGYSAADLLLAALTRGIDPGTLPKLGAAAAQKGGDDTTDA